MKKGFKFFYAFAAVMLTAYICSALTEAGINSWYNDIAKPALVPPNIVFPIFWSVIYVLLIFSTFIALREADSYMRRKANNLFIVQLLLQILWCFTFFAEGYLGLGFAVIVLLDIAVFRMIVVYNKINRLSAWLLYPYYWWLVFATFLNGIFVYNSGLIVVF